MKLMRMFAVAALLASSQLVYGQDIDVMSVNVPFAFNASGVSMPAGRYMVSRLIKGRLWGIRKFGGKGIFLEVKPLEFKKAPGNSSLVFDHDATGYTLRQIEQQGQAEVTQVVEPGRAKTRHSTAEQVASVTALAR